MYRSLGVTKGIARTAAGALIDVLLPPHCAACGTPGALICGDCRRQMQRAEGPRCRRCWLPSDAPICRNCLSKPQAVRALRTGFVYDGPTRAAVLALKHGGFADLAVELVQMSGQLRVAKDVDIIVPIPIPLLRRRRRGGNQAEHIARAIAARTRIAFDGSVLRRRGWWGPRQAQARSRANRSQLVSGAFMAESERVAGRGVLLVDDVSTTMATLTEAARILLASGARAVDAWAVARAE